MNRLRIKNTNTGEQLVRIHLPNGTYPFTNDTARATECTGIAFLGRHRILLTEAGIMRWHGKRSVGFGPYEFSVVRTSHATTPQIPTLERTMGARERSHDHKFKIRDSRGCCLDITEQPLIVGRHASCDIQLNDPQVSNFHFAIHLRHGGVEFHDLFSRNGTHFNGAEMHHARCFGGSIRIGCSQLAIERSEERAHLELTSSPMQWVNQQLAKLAPTDFPVMLLGESGTGKELAARMVHRCSGRKGRFIPINSAGVQTTLSSSELFGHVRGAYTGAVTDHAGAFQAAHDGTLFLDEIGDMPLEIQAELLRAVEDGIVRPVGSVTGTRVNTRIVGATNRDLEGMVRSGRFREDLYHRLMVFPVRLPPLRERTEDIPALAEFILQELETPRQVSTRGLEKLQRHSWPGNVRELANTLRRAALFSNQAVIPESAIQFTTHLGSTVRENAATLLHDRIIDVYQETRCVIQTAKALGLRRPVVRQHLELWEKSEQLRLAQ